MPFARWQVIQGASLVSSLTYEYVFPFIYHLLKFFSKQGNIVVSGSSDSTIRIWNVHSGELLNTLSGHTDLVRTLQFDRIKIISGSYDRTLRIWNLSTGSTLLDLKSGGHYSKVFKLQYNEARIVSCVSFHSLNFHELKWQNRVKTTRSLYGILPMVLKVLGYSYPIKKMNEVLLLVDCH